MSETVGIKTKVQKLGRALSGMVMPNIGAFIAWGFITALFIEKGWLPNAQLAEMVTPMLKYVLPVLIGYTGGKMIAGDRGSVIGAIATVGIVVGAGDTTMLIGGMIMGPLGGWVIKKFDELVDGKIPSGFEMLVNNFSVGILGLILAIIGFYAIGPVVIAITSVLQAGVEFLVKRNLIFLTSLFIEPAKVLFLNNAINHGILSPLGIEQAKEMGSSIMFLLEANPGPGLGVLLAYAVFSKDKVTKSSAPGAIIIHFFGGIHEIYFPYILMNPIVIIAPIVGNICAITFFTFTKCGLIGPSSPGSIIAYLSMSPKSQIPLTILGVLIATVVSFLIASPIIRMSDGKSLEDAQDDMAAKKAESKGITVDPGEKKDADKVKKIVFACDAGMGSSAMGATKFRNRVKAQRPDLTVINTSVDNIPADCDIAVVQAVLADRARKSAPQAQLVIINNFLQDPNLDGLYEQMTAKVDASAQTAAAVEEVETPVATGNAKILVEEGIKTGLKPVNKFEAIKAAGKLLNELGYVEEGYIDAMVKREETVTTYMGLGVAIPHGTGDAKKKVQKTGIVMLQYPEGVDFDGEKAQLVFGIAGIGDEHLGLLAKISEIIEDPERLEQLKTTENVDEIMEMFK